MTWDADRKTVVSAESGFDMGKPYHGTSILKSSKSRTPTDHELPPDFPGSSKSRTPTDHELPRDFPEDAFAMATLASIGASEQKAAKHGDTTRTHRR